MHRDYIKEHRSISFNNLCLSGDLWTYLADLNEQEQLRLEFLIEQMKSSEGTTEELKVADQMAWVVAIISIAIVQRKSFYEKDAINTSQCVQAPHWN